MGSLKVWETHYPKRKSNPPPKIYFRDFPVLEFFALMRPSKLRLRGVFLSGPLEFLTLEGALPFPVFDSLSFPGAEPDEPSKANPTALPTISATISDPTNLPIDSHITQYST